MCTGTCSRTYNAKGQKVRSLPPPSTSPASSSQVLPLSLHACQGIAHPSSLYTWCAGQALGTLPPKALGDPYSGTTILSYDDAVKAIAPKMYSRKTYLEAWDNNGRLPQHPQEVYLFSGWCGWDAFLSKTDKTHELRMLAV